MKTKIFFFLVVLLWLGVSSSCASKKCVEKQIDDCICTMQYDPVCGCNNKTYSNACVAECAGIFEYQAGPCDKS